MLGFGRSGASSGIGFAICKELNSLGFRVYGNVINENEAVDLERATNNAVQPLIFDVRDAAAVNEAARSVGFKAHCKSRD